MIPFLSRPAFWRRRVATSHIRAPGLTDTPRRRLKAAPDFLPEMVKHERHLEVHVGVPFRVLVA